MCQYFVTVNSHHNQTLPTRTPPTQLFQNNTCPKTKVRYRPKNAISNRSLDKLIKKSVPERIAVIGAVGLAIGNGISSVMEMIVVSGMEE